MALRIGPILARELLTNPRKPRHFILRSTYVAIFFILMWTAWQAVAGFSQVERAGDYAHFHTVLFTMLVRLEVVLVLFFSSLYGTSSLSHEKDRRTLVLLMMTRLKDGEIIVEKFLTGMLQVGTLVLTALPAYALLLLLGGVSVAQLLEAYAVTLGAALLANAIGVLIAAWREKTFQSVALTLLSIVFFQLAVEVAARLAGPRFEYALTSLSPFRALGAVLDLDRRFEYGAFPPAVTFLIFASAAAAGMLAFASYKLRDWYPTGEPIMERETPPAGAAVPAPVAETPYREVTGNPVYWRETETRAYGTRAILIKAGYALVAATALAIGWGATFGRPAAPARAVDENGVEIVEARARPTRQSDAPLTAVVVSLAVLSLLLVNAQAVTAITSERDLKALDLLLATRVTPPQFIFGKLLGILFNVKEIVAVPALVMIAAGATGQIGATAMFYSLGTFATFTAFAALLGVHAALRYESARLAIAHSLGTMFLLFVGILICMFLILVSGNERFGAQWLSFLLFIVLGSIGLWLSLSANAPSNAIALTASLLPFATFYCVVAFLVGDQAGPFLVGTSIYGFALAALLVPLLAEFDVATGRTSHAEGS